MLALLQDCTVNEREYVKNCMVAHTTMCKASQVGLAYSEGRAMYSRSSVLREGGENGKHGRRLIAYLESPDFLLMHEVRREGSPGL